MIRKGEVRVNSGRTKPLYKVKEGDIIRIPPYLNNESQPKRPISSKLQDRFKKRVIYEDLNYIILNKPSGTAVHSGSGNNIGVIDVLRSFYTESVDLCHRLDKETSGCLVFAKNKTALRFFNKSLALRDKDLKKTYLAILKGNFKKELFIDNNINTTKSSIDHKVNINSEEGKYASSLFRPIKKLNKSSLVEIDIYSGRTHQIRVQAESLNHNVANDIKYGDAEYNNFISKSGIKGMALHAKLIEFMDEDNNLIQVEAPLEDSFADLIDYLN
jgi:23S rRNA pseudouridine955/2504/2580 synthase